MDLPDLMMQRPAAGGTPRRSEENSDAALSDGFAESLLAEQGPSPEQTDSANDGSVATSLFGDAVASVDQTGAESRLVAENGDATAAPAEALLDQPEPRQVPVDTPDFDVRSGEEAPPIAKSDALVVTEADTGISPAKLAAPAAPATQTPNVALVRSAAIPTEASARRLGQSSLAPDLKTGPMPAATPAPANAPSSAELLVPVPDGATEAAPKPNQTSTPRTGAEAFTETSLPTVETVDPGRQAGVQEPKIAGSSAAAIPATAPAPPPPGTRDASAINNRDRQREGRPALQLSDTKATISEPSTPVAVERAAPASKVAQFLSAFGATAGADPSSLSSMTNASTTNSGPTLAAAGAAPQASAPVNTPAAPIATVFTPSLVDRSLLPQIVGAIQTAPGGGTIDLMLDPPELGRIEIVLEMVETTLRATLSMDRPATADLIRRHAEMLMNHFEDAGFSDVDLTFAEDNQSNDRGTGDGDALSLSTQGMAADGNSNESEGATRARLLTESRMDLRL